MTFKIGKIETCIELKKYYFRISAIKINKEDAFILFFLSFGIRNNVFKFKIKLQ